MFYLKERRVVEIETLNILSPTLLIAIGIFLIATEAITFSFILFWFGLASIIVGLLSFIIDFPTLAWQLTAISIIALLSLFSLRTKALELFLKTKENDEVKDNFLNTGGDGVVKNSKVYYKATFWDCDTLEEFEEGEKVRVLEAKRGKVIIEKKSLL